MLKRTRMSLFKLAIKLDYFFLLHQRKYYVFGGTHWSRSNFKIMNIQAVQRYHKSFASYNYEQRTKK